MERTININLLKEYIKTLIATEVVFPGIVPRQWGNEFTRLELQVIHSTLKFVLRTANNTQNPKALIDAVRQVEKPDLNLHWFLCDHWEAIVSILIKYPYVLVRKSSLLHELN
ncbi:hypothetical protein GO755_08915 [Spirosoma sp. HMF4905]|uniref:Uncharacterized protein n=1 Tax=Spirosoma arboris TaxID=2682092 RepID=A0A7K1S8K9_9BACT|nr:hypothetical protein [Spirosoma arboris]MVM30153.1 hypothetical protein [Spirosoma arboris]